MYGAILGDIIGSPFEFDRGDKTKNFEITINEFIEEYIADYVLNNGCEDKTEYTYIKTGEYSYSILENEG